MPETKPAPGSPAALVKWALGKLSVDFPASFPDTTMARARELSLRELLAAHPWVTPPVLERAVYLIRWKHQGPFIPPPAVLIDYFEAAATDLERQRREQAAKLPPPPPPTDGERRAQDDRTEAAKLKARLSLPERLRARRKR
jgi:hypothetical protein